MSFDFLLLFLFFRSYDALKIEKIQLTDYLLTMKYFLLKEIKLEEVTRFKLIRERMNNCAQGNIKYCDLYKIGYNDNDELLGEGYYDIDARKKLRIKFHEQKEEKNYFNSLNGLQKVKSSICEGENLLPDESPRVFVLLGDYMNYVQSKAGNLFHQKTVNEIQRSTLFGPFLEDGEKGFLLFCLVSSETVGLIFSPLIFSLNSIRNIIFSQVIKVDNNMKLLLNSIIENNPNSTVSTLYSHINSTYTATETEGTNINNIIRFLDPFRYSGIMTVFDFLYPYYSGPIWVLGVIWQTPSMYYDYYVRSLYENLPERRHACLLKYGIKTAENELKSVEMKIVKEDNIRSEKINKEKNKNNNKKNKKIARDKKRKDDKKNNKNNEIISYENVDFGPSDSWENVKELCLENTFNDYKYNFCFFGKFYQGNTLLGKFSDWGVSKLDKSNIYHDDNNQNTNHNKNSDKNSDENEFDGDDENENEGWLSFQSKKVDETKKIRNQRFKYSHQIYDEGTVCQG